MLGVSLIRLSWCLRFMHAGFAMLETGCCRAKRLAMHHASHALPRNASNVLMKNLVNVPRHCSLALVAKSKSQHAKTQFKGQAPCGIQGLRRDDGLVGLWLGFRLWTRGILTACSTAGGEHDTEMATLRLLHFALFSCSCPVHASKPNSPGKC